MRKKAREILFQLVFASRFSDGDVSELKKALFKKENLDKNDAEYCEKVLSLIDEHESEFAEIVDSHSPVFPQSRIFPADKSVLFIALAEIKYMEDIPKVVSVNEAANIAAKYSSPKSATFISGILSGIIKE